MSSLTGYKSPPKTLSGIQDINADSATFGDIQLSGGTISGISTLDCVNISGTLSTASQPNITTVGNLNGLSVSGNITQNSGTATLKAITCDSINCSGNITNTQLQDLESKCIYITGSNLAKNATIASGLIVENPQESSSSFECLPELDSARVKGGMDLAVADSGTLYIEDHLGWKIRMSPILADINVPLTVGGNITQSGETTATLKALTCDSVNCSGIITNTQIQDLESKTTYQSISQLGDDCTVFTNNLRIETAQGVPVIDVDTQGGDVLVDGLSTHYRGASNISFWSDNTPSATQKVQISSSVASFNVPTTISDNLTCTGNITGTLTTASQPNITTVGNLTGVTIAGNISQTTGTTTLQALTVPSISCSGNISGTLTTLSQPNITTVGNLTGLTVAGNLTHGNIIIQPNTKGSLVLQNCITVGTEEADFTVFGGTHTSDNSTDYTFSATSAQSTQEAYRAFGTNSGQWLSATRYTIAGANNDNTTGITDYRETAIIRYGQYLQAICNTFTFNPIEITVTLVKQAGNGSAPKELTVYALFGNYSTHNKANWCKIYEYTNPSNSTNTITFTAEYRDFGAPMSRLLFQVNSMYPVGDGITLPCASLKGITARSLRRLPMECLYVGQSLQVGTEYYRSATLPSYPLEVNGDAYVQRTVFSKPPCFIVEMTEGNGNAVGAGAIIHQVGNITVKANTYGMFSQNATTGWGGAFAPRTGIYQINFNARFTDTTNYLTVVPTILGVRNLSTVWVPSDPNGRRVVSWNQLIYLEEGQVFAFYAPYACSVLWWTYSGYYVGDCFNH